MSSIPASGILLTLSGAEELIELKSWFSSAEQQHSWGGDDFEYPCTLPVFLQHLCRPGADCYSLLSTDAQQSMLGFGQICDRFGKHHLARLAIHPAHRGQGLARVLICELMLNALAHQPLDFSLYVHRHNSVALHCYQSLGFQFAAQPEMDNDRLYFMVLPAEQAIKICQTYLDSYIRLFDECSDGHSPLSPQG
ncbi:GNAT family N-acetyltransferase [Chromatiaceae bacterium AAb-1]|nr:GNAT family N-acetyltransferase [Chromatiaceae bacterium AAb-1]